MSLNQEIVAGVKKFFDSKEIIINIIPQIILLIWLYWKCGGKCWY